MGKWSAMWVRRQVRISSSATGSTLSSKRTPIIAQFEPMRSENADEVRSAGDGVRFRGCIERLNPEVRRMAGVAPTKYGFDTTDAELH